MQISKSIGKQLEIYAGGKNLLNFIPNNPIMRLFDPISNPNKYTFDPSYNYAPIQGISGYLGVRWKSGVNGKII